MLYDAHNHLMDERLDPWREEILRADGMVMVVNGTCEGDWSKVIGCDAPQVLRSVGLHPWYVGQRTERWEDNLKRALDSGRCGIGEVGLDRWMESPDIEAQEKVFVTQLQIAASRNVPMSIHCLKSWGRLNEILSAEQLPGCGFLLHSYNGSKEMIERFVELGAYFSISGYFAHERKEKQREAFKAVPLDRLLVETDAPDMLPPAHLDRRKVGVNHPENLANVYRFAAELFHVEHEAFVRQVEENFRRLFGSILK